MAVTASTARLFRTALRNVGARRCLPVTCGPRAPPRPRRRAPAVLWVGERHRVSSSTTASCSRPDLHPPAGQISWRVVEPGLDPADVPPLDAVLLAPPLRPPVTHLARDAPPPRRQGPPRVDAGGPRTVPDMPFDASDLGPWERWSSRGLRVTAVPVATTAGAGADPGWTCATRATVVEHRGVTVYFGGDTAYVRENFLAAARRRASTGAPADRARRAEALHRAEPPRPRRGAPRLEDLGAARMVPDPLRHLRHPEDAVGDPSRVRR